MATTFSVERFHKDPISYIGKRNVVTPTLAASLENCKVTCLSVPVQKEDNNYVNIIEKCSITELQAPQSRRTVYMRFNERGECLIEGTKNAVNAQEVETYYLPWTIGAAYSVRLDDKLDFFTTAKLNACCIMISGTQEAPLVIHANYDPEDGQRLNLGGLSNDEGRKLHLKQYTRFYGNLAHELVRQKILSEHTNSIFDPAFYLDKGSVGTVFGVRKDGKWKFFFTMMKPNKEFVTAELWPVVVGRMPYQI